MKLRLINLLYDELNFIKLKVNYKTYLHWSIGCLFAKRNFFQTNVGQFRWLLFKSSLVGKRYILKPIKKIISSRYIGVVSSYFRLMSGPTLIVPLGKKCLTLLHPALFRGLKKKKHRYNASIVCGLEKNLLYFEHKIWRICPTPPESSR